MRILPLLFPVLLLAGGCRASPRVPGASFAGVSFLAPLSDAEEVHGGLLRADLSRTDSVARLGYARGLGSVLASDVLYLRGGLPIVRGRAGAVSIAEAESIGPSVTVRWQPVRAEASVDGKSGFSYGYTIYGSSQPTMSPSLRIDRYIAFWRRENTSWHIAAYAETYGTPPAALALPPAALLATLRDEPMSAASAPLDAIRAADVEFSEEAGKQGAGRAFGHFAASDAQIFSGPGEFISGPEAIMQSFGAPTSGSSLTWHPVAAEISRSGDLGFTVGNAIFASEHDIGAARAHYSKYLTVWKRQRDGRWRYVVDGGSTRTFP